MINEKRGRKKNGGKKDMGIEKKIKKSNDERN
jgi:hypothetical protein